MQTIQNHQELTQWAENKNRAFVLLYKSQGAEQNECAKNNLLKAESEFPGSQLALADVAVTRDIHPVYGIESVPSVLEFQNGRFIRIIKGCHDVTFYTSLFTNQAVETTNAASSEKHQKNVVVYSTPTCSWCNTLKNYLKDHQIKFRDVDVSRDAKAAEEMVKRSGQQGVPQTTINGEVIVGFDKNRIDRLLGIQSK